MKLPAASVYRCPVRGAPLDLIVFDEERVALPSEEKAKLCALDLDPAPYTRFIRNGLLVNREDGYFYPVFEGIPVLLDFKTPIYDQFERRFADRRATWEGLRPPHSSPRPGEKMTQKSFTTEWRAIRDEEELSFTWTPSEREEFIRMEIAWPRRASKDWRTLDVGCGIGYEALALANVTQRPVFAIDLNFGLWKTVERLKATPLVHTALASAFAPPFDRTSFDLVYSHGVLMANFNTEKALDSILRFRKPQAPVVIWVYAHEDAQRGKFSRKIVYLLELMFRPMIASMPGPLQSAVIHALARHHYRKYRRTGLKRDLWKFRHSVHSMRDRWTPRHAHRHSFNEVIGWFVERGLQYHLLDPVEYRKKFNRHLMGIGIRGEPNSPPRQDARSGRTDS